MTEEEWLACDDARTILQVVSQYPLSNLGISRKASLFLAICCHRLSPLIHLSIGKDAVEWLNLMAECQPTKQDSNEIYRSLMVAFKDSQDEREKLALIAINNARRVQGTNLYEPVRQVALEARAAIAFKGSHAVENRVQCDLLREIFGNPFHPVTINPSWLTSTVFALAQGIYADRTFDRMPILADALQDAGCDNDDILNHCRQPGEHVRGCWAIDLLLTKQ